MTAERTCISCGAPAPRGELMRVVLDPDGRPVVDTRQRLPGRGAYVCWQRSCVEGAARGYRRAFKRAVQGGEGVLDLARGHTRRTLVETCALAQKSGGLKTGGHTVKMALAHRWGCAGLLASDASEETAARHRRLCGKQELPVWVLTLTSEEFGNAVGKGVRSVGLLRSGALTAKLERTLQRSRGLL